MLPKGGFLHVNVICIVGHGVEQVSPDSKQLFLSQIIAVGNNWVVVSLYFRTSARYSYGLVMGQKEPVYFDLKARVYALYATVHFFTERNRN